MSLHYIYSDAPLSTIDLTDRCRVSENRPLKEQAEEGAVPISTLVIDDPLGDLIIVGHRRLYTFEDTAPVDNQVIHNGFVANERVERGPSDLTGVARTWTVDLSDPNVLINRRIMNGTDANRPAENDVERMTALLAMTELNTVDDDLYFSTASPVDMDAVDYRGQNVGAYIDDCRQASGKNAYIWFNEPLGQYSLWYDFATSIEYDSACFLSNVLSEIDFDTVFAYSQERTYINFDPSRVASGIYLDFDNATDSPVYVQSATTLANFAAIDWAAPSVNVKTLAKATARANRYLSDAGSETAIVHVVMTKVPRDKVNSIKNGQLVSFKATWGPGFEDYVRCRVLYRIVSEITEDPTAGFEIEMDLAPVDMCPDATEAGYRPPLFAFATNAEGNLWYSKAGGDPGPEVPDPGFSTCSEWNFPVYHTADGTNPSGFNDGTFGKLNNTIRMNIVGPGTVTIYTTAFPTSGHFSWHLDHREPFPIGVVTDDSADNVPSGTTVVIQIPDDDWCYHWLDLEEPTGGADGGSAFGGFDWVPA